MRRLVLGGLLALWVTGALSAQGFQGFQTATTCSVSPTRLRPQESISIDGLLGEAVWKRAARLGALVQTDPDEGASPSQPTMVRLCYDSEHIYLGILCREQPGLVRARLMQRDPSLDPDDRVEFWFDTFHDHRFAYWFQIGAGGSKGDALIADNGNSFNKSWDGIWHGKSRVTAKGWQAEVAVPFKTLAFKQGLQTWGSRPGASTCGACGWRTRRRIAGPRRWWPIVSSSQARGAPSRVSRGCSRAWGWTWCPMPRLGSRATAQRRSTSPPRAILVWT